MAFIMSLHDHFLRGLYWKHSECDRFFTNCQEVHFKGIQMSENLKTDLTILVDNGVMPHGWIMQNCRSDADESF